MSDGELQKRIGEALASHFFIVTKWQGKKRDPIKRDWTEVIDEAKEDIDVAKKKVWDVLETPSEGEEGKIAKKIIVNAVFSMLCDTLEKWFGDSEQEQMDCKCDYA